MQLYHLIPLVQCLMLAGFAEVNTSANAGMIRHSRHAYQLSDTIPSVRQTDETLGFVRGKIVDAASGTAIQGARISFTNLDGDLSELLSTPPEDTTRASGDYHIQDLKPARYAVECAAQGYRKFSGETVVKAGGTDFLVRLVRKGLFE